MKRKAGKAKKIEFTPCLPAFGKVQLHPALRKYLGYCFFKSAAIIRQRFDERFTEYGLVGPQFGMLTILKEEGPITQNEMAKYMAIDKATMVRLIDNLEESKFVARIQSKEDRRANHLQITKAGEQIVTKLSNERKAWEEEFFNPLTKAEREQLVALIDKLTAAVEK